MSYCQQSGAGCAITPVLSLVGGKWKIAILYLLGQRTHRFNELRKVLPGITQKMLTLQLRELEAHHLVHRQVYPVIPPRVEYRLTDIGRKLLPIFEEMCAWGHEYAEHVQTLPQETASWPVE